MWTHKFLFFWDKYSRMQLLGHVVILWETVILFSRVAVTFLLAMYEWMIQFSTSSPSFGVTSINFSHCDRYIVISLCAFNLHFPSNDVENLFMCWFAIYVSFPVKCQFMPFAHFLIGLLVFYCWVLRVCYIF